MWVSTTSQREAWNSRTASTFKAANYNLVLDTEVVTFEIAKVNLRQLRSPPRR